LEIPEAIEKRKSIRAYVDKDLTDEEAETLIRAATKAPSAGNMQPWAFILVRDKKVKEHLIEAAHGQSFIGSAPVVIVVCADPARTSPRYGNRGTTLYCLQDTAAAVENILLTAAQNGFGTCWVGAFDEDMATKALGLPNGIRPVAIVPVGLPAQDPQPRSRRNLKEVIHRDHW
jgi:nitroreductase